MAYSASPAPVGTKKRMKTGRKGMTSTMYDSALAQSVYGAPRAVTPRLRTGANPIRVKRLSNGKPLPMSVTMYDTALTEGAYGRPMRLGDFFGDVMGAVVGQDRWNARPDWMKKIKVRPDPMKLLRQAASVVPPQQIGRVLDQANAAGVNMYYQTPAGAVPINSMTAEGLYSGLPVLAEAKSALSNVPWWAWAAGGGVLLLAIGSMRK